MINRIFNKIPDGTLVEVWEPDTSATRHFGTKFKPNHRWSCVSRRNCPRSEVTQSCSGYGVGLVIERSRVGLPAGALLGSLGQLSLPSLRGR